MSPLTCLYHCLRHAALFFPTSGLLQSQYPHPRSPYTYGHIRAKLPTSPFAFKIYGSIPLGRKQVSPRCSYRMNCRCAYPILHQMGARNQPAWVSSIVGSSVAESQHFTADCSRNWRWEYTPGSLTGSRCECTVICRDQGKERHSMKPIVDLW